MAKDNSTVRIGQCINFGNCQKADSRELQKINIGDEFICTEPGCEGTLIEPPKSPPFPWWIIIVIAAVLLLGGLFLGYPSIKSFFEKKAISEISHPITSDGLTVDSTSLSSESNEAEKLPPSPSKSYSFGKYVGQLKNGIPDGQGTMYYNKSIRIAKHAGDPYYAESGDVFVGTWGNGDIVNGKLLDKNNNLKAIILAGKRPNPYNIGKD